MAEKKKETAAAAETAAAEETKATATAAKPTFTKARLLASKKYRDIRDMVTAVIPDDFSGTAAEADALIEKFRKGKVN